MIKTNWNEVLAIDALIETNRTIGKRQEAEYERAENWRKSNDYFAKIMNGNEQPVAQDNA